MRQETTALAPPAEQAASGQERLPYWAIISREFDELGLTKAEFRIMCHVCRRAGKTRACEDAVSTMARITRTHPSYVRWIVRHLVARKLIQRVVRPGTSNWLVPSPKFEWLAKFGSDADKVPTAYEETAAEVGELKLWARIWAVMPGAPKAPFQAQMRADRWLFESVLAEVEDRVKRGKMVGPDSLDPVKNVRGLWNYTWELFGKSNPAKGRGTIVK